MTTLIDASGAGIGGISLILNEVVKNWPQNEPLILIGVVKGKEKDFVQFHHRDVQVLLFRKIEFSGSCKHFFLALRCGAQ
jgi:hypothetical protein